MIEKVKSFLKDKEKVNHYIIYFVFGVLTTIISFASFWIIRKIAPSLDSTIAQAISVILAIIFAYFTNRKYVFKSNESNKLKEFGKFLLSRAASFVFETVSFWLLVEFTFLGSFEDKSVGELIAKLICSFFVMIINYVFSRFLVFNEKKNSEG